MSKLPSSPLRILLVSQELAPYARAGDLADYVAGLARALRLLGHDVRVVLPLHGAVDRRRFELSVCGSLCVRLDRGDGGDVPGRELWAAVQTPAGADLGRVLFVEHDALFDRDGIYASPGGGVQGDDGLRAVMLSLGALQLVVDRGFRPDIVHAHDWPAAATALYLRDDELRPGRDADDLLRDVPCVLTVHEPAAQGVLDPGAASAAGLGAVFARAGLGTPDGAVSLLRAGISAADRVVAPSRAASLDFLDPAEACGLEDAFAAAERRLTGIGAGIDEDDWNPETDPRIPARFARRNLLGKARCKADLQAESGLEARADLPLVLLAGDGDLVAALASELRDDPRLQLVVPTGDSMGAAESLARVLAAADLLVSVARRDPGASLVRKAMRYGCLPIARARGGVSDAVADLDADAEHGAAFLYDAADASSARAALERALRAWFQRPGQVAQARRRAMSVRSSWDDPARAHEELYRSAIAERARARHEQEGRQ